MVYELERRFPWTDAMKWCEVAFVAHMALVIGACSSPRGAAPDETVSMTPDCQGETFGLAPEARAVWPARIAAKRGTMGTASRQMVASSHRLATEAGLAVLRSGGNAIDAFIAAALVQDVVLPGVTSTAGIAGVMVYHAGSQALTYVHGGLADPIAPEARYRPDDTALGRQVLVPGAPGAYAALHERFGSRPLRELVEPAASLAEGGFPADALYAAIVSARQDTLRRSHHGRQSFFREGVPITSGETVKLVELATTLRAFGDDPAWFYRGAWAREAVALVTAHGGALTEADFATYAPDIGSPIHGRYLGNDVYAAGHGGAKLLVALGALEILNAGPPSVSPHMSADALERLLRVQRQVQATPFLSDRVFLARGAGTEEDIARAAQSVAARVVERAEEPRSSFKGSHSSAVVVVDTRGNVVVGTHTIQAASWGEGLFVGGVPLSTSAGAGLDDAASAPSRIRADPLTNTIVLRDGKVRAGLAVYGTGLHPTDVQLLDAVLARSATPEEAVLTPRLGYFQFDLSQLRLYADRSVVDPRFDDTLLCQMKQRGFVLERSMPGYPPGIVDTGFPTLVTMTPSGLLGMTPELMDGFAAGD